MLTFYVEDQSHGRIRTFSDDPRNSFLQVARRAAASGSAVLDAVDAYSDSMLNFKQLEQLVEELGSLLGDSTLSSAERRKVSEVRDAAVEARGLSGYLFIEGD